MTTPSTPLKRLGLARPRPSLANAPAFSTSNSNREAAIPNNLPSLEKSPLLSPSTMLARKASLNQLTQNSLASIPDGTVGYGLGSPTRSTRDDYRGRSTPIGADVEVGDAVNTPGGMHGTVKFIGNVKGKAGIFVGVELDTDMSGRGKNDGAVDGWVLLIVLSSLFVCFRIRCGQRGSELKLVLSTVGGMHSGHLLFRACFPWKTIVCPSNSFLSSIFLPFFLLPG